MTTSQNVPLDAAPSKDRRNYGHEPGHLVLDLGVRLQTDIEIENDFVKACGLNSLQSLDDLCRRAKQYRVFGEVLWLHVA